MSSRIPLLTVAVSFFLLAGVIFWVATQDRGRPSPEPRATTQVSNAPRASDERPAGNAPDEPHDDKENEGHTFADTVDAIRTEKGHGRPSMYGAAPAHVMRSHEEMSPKKRGWWGGVRDVMKGGQRSIDTIKLAKNMGDEQKKYKERSKRELDAWEEKYKFDKDTDEAKDAREEIEKKNKRHFVHMAEMFRDLALTNGGFQVKLCQMLAMNTALFPEDVRAPLRECCEKAWNVPLATILPNIEGKKRGLGRRYQEVFETLEPEAMAKIPKTLQSQSRPPRVPAVLKRGLETAT